MVVDNAAPATTVAVVSILVSTSTVHNTALMSSFLEIALLAGAACLALPHQQPLLLRPGAHLLFEQYLSIMKDCFTHAGYIIGSKVWASAVTPLLFVPPSSFPPTQLPQPTSTATQLPHPTPPPLSPSQHLPSPGCTFVG